MEFYQEPDESVIQNLVHWIVDIIVVIAFACYLIYSFGTRVQVSGSSMNPVLNSGDVVLMNRFVYDLGNPSRYDIAVFQKENSSYNLKRIIGLPGETVQIKDNLVYIDGIPLTTDDPLGHATIAGVAEYPIELGDDEYFLLGDNRESSEDSRFSGIGMIKREQLTGKVWFKFQPIEEFGLIH
ncbi:MAG: signal peptidase I [Lachnospiraceae bacterium]|nr:signal peptidase I [Lachnospiraceae bacterium]